MTTMLRSLFRLLSVFGMLLLLYVPALAQENQFVCRDETDRLSCSEIATAAQPLLIRGAKVAVFMVPQGDSSGADFLARLREANLASDDTVDAGLVAIYVSLDPRYAELRGGDRWNAALLANDNITTIRTTKLVPALGAGNFTAGFVDTLAAIDAAIANPPQPGVPGQPTTVVNINTPNTTPLAWSLLGVAALLGGGYVALRWRKARNARAEASWYYTDAKQAASERIVDVGRALQIEREKAAYDAVSYGSDDVARLAAMQHAIDEQFAQVQTRFEAVDEQFKRHAKPSVARYESAAEGYKGVQQQLKELQQQLNAQNKTRQELDGIAQQAPALVQQAKTQLADATRLLQPLAITERGHALAPLHEQVAQAEAALTAHDARRAIALAEATSAALANLHTTVHSYNEYQTAIAQARNEAAVLEQQGYRVAACCAALQEAERMLKAGAAALERGEASAEPFANVAAALEQAKALGRGMLTLRAENDQRLLALGTRANEVAALLGNARQKFDIVDEFAPTTWSDIRGNGSQAEALHAEAATLWQQAVAENTIEQQAFAAAQGHLGAVETNLASATALCEAIVQRLGNLEHARAIAQDELAFAAADIASGETFLRANDADVGSNPAEQLQKASVLLAEAQTEAAKPKPDWLQLVRLAQAANAEADRALAMPEPKRK